MANGKLIKAFLISITILSFILKGTPLLILTLISLLFFVSVNSNVFKKVFALKMLFAYLILFISPFFIGEKRAFFFGMAYSPEFLALGLNTFLRTLILMPSMTILLKINSNYFNYKINKSNNINYFLNDSISYLKRVESEIKTIKFKNILLRPIDTIATLIAKLLK